MSGIARIAKNRLLRHFCPESPLLQECPEVHLKRLEDCTLYSGIINKTPKQGSQECHRLGVRRTTYGQEPAVSRQAACQSVLPVHARYPSSAGRHTGRPAGASLPRRGLCSGQNY